MAAVKQEREMGIDESDMWLKQWVDPGNNKVKNEDNKQELTFIKKESEDFSESSMEVTHGTLDRNDTKGLADTKKKQKRKAGVSKTATSSDETVDAKKALNLSTSWEESLENAPVSECVENRCKYECPKCNLVFGSKLGIQRHFNETRHVQVSYGETKKYIKSIVAHKCLICEKKILCDLKVIKSHLYSKHKIYSMKQYRNKKCKKLPVKMDFKSFIKTLKGKWEISKGVGSYCKFSCHKCIYTCQSWATLRHHLKSKEHGPSLTPFNYITEVVLHNCIICKMSLLCDVRIIITHLKNHGHSLQSYKSLIKGSSHENIFLEYQLKLKSEIHDIPIVKPKNKLKLEPHSISNSETTKHVGNLSWFKCSYCSKTNMSFGSLQKHCYNVHQKGNFSYKKELVMEARYHQCLICETIILCDRSVIYKHLNYSHKINLEQYNKSYVIKSGGRVFPTFREYLNNWQVFECLELQRKDVTDSKCHKSDLILPSMISSESEDSDEESK